MYMLGRIPSPPDERDHPLRMYANVEGLDLPNYFGSWVRWPVYDQGQTPQCVAYSACLTRHISERRDDRKNLTFDAPELYARCKELDGIPNEDGTYMRTAAEILRHRGAQVMASTRAKDVGSFKPIKGYARLRTLEEIKASIFLMGSAWIGSWWYDSWERPYGDFGTPTLKFPRNPSGGHAYTLVGWSDYKEAFKMQNSWGPKWGRVGKAWLPYEYIDLSNEEDWEAWRLIDLDD